MPNIDTSTIQGYTEMTAEQKVAALEGFQIPEAIDMSRFVTKETFDKKASESTEWKRKHDALLDDDAKKKQEEADAIASIKSELADVKAQNAALLKDKAIAEYKAQYMSQGMDATLAEDTAKALCEGDMKKVFANQAKHNDALQKKIRADLMKADPKPGAGGGNSNDGNLAGAEQAKRIGKAKAEADKYAEDVMKFYIK